MPYLFRKNYSKVNFQGLLMTDESKLMVVFPLRDTLTERSGIGCITCSWRRNKPTHNGFMLSIQCWGDGLCSPRTCQGLRKVRDINLAPHTSHAPPTRLLVEKTDGQKFSCLGSCPTVDQRVQSWKKNQNPEILTSSPMLSDFHCTHTSFWKLEGKWRNHLAWENIDKGIPSLC